MKTPKRGKISLAFLFGIGMSLVMVVIFAFSVKGTDEYACALQQASTSEIVTRDLGEPIEAGLVAILYARETGGAQASTRFATGIRGPYGKGRIRVDAYRAPVGAYLLVQYKGGDDWVDIHNGPYPCE
jgi:hypothetical protein